jgi:soluble lytic murein transglycosylase
LYSPSINIVLGIRYLAHLRRNFQGQGTHYLAAYNMGARNVRRLLAQNTNPRIYSDKILKSYKGLYSNFVYGDAREITTWSLAGR